MGFCFSSRAWARLNSRQPSCHYLSFTKLSLASSQTDKSSNFILHCECVYSAKQRCTNANFTQLTSDGAYRQNASRRRFSASSIGLILASTSICHSASPCFGLVIAVLTLPSLKYSTLPRFPSQIFCLVSSRDRQSLRKCNRFSRKI